MKIRNGSVLTAAVVAVALILVASSAQAGVVFTDETAFNNAVAGLGLTPAWSENFEGFAPGAVADPLLIAGGLAEVVDGGNAFIVPTGPTGNGWLQNGGTQANATIRGPANSDLGMSALSFNFGNENVQFVSFAGSGGVDVSTPYAPSTSATTNFVGWIGLGPETVSQAQFTQTGGITLDNITVFSAHTPEPGTFLLFGLGAAGLFFANRRRKAGRGKA